MEKKVTTAIEWSWKLPDQVGKPGESLAAPSILYLTYEHIFMFSSQWNNSRSRTRKSVNFKKKKNL